MTYKLFNIEELQADDDFDDEFESLSEEEIKKLLPTFPVTKLADIIVTNRYVGLFKNLAVEAMEELAKRRVSGDNFAYESYIEENLNNLPKLNLDIPNISSILNSLKGFKV